MQELIAEGIRFALIGFFTTLTFLLLWFVLMVFISIIAKAIAGDEDN